MLLTQSECDKSFGSEFVFSDHSKELIVGEIFVRVYNEQPAYPLEVSSHTHNLRIAADKFEQYSPIILSGTLTSFFMPLLPPSTIVPQGVCC